MNWSSAVNFLLFLMCYGVSGLYSVDTNKVKELFGEDYGQFIFTSEVINDSDLPEIGNGHVATQLKNKYIFMNGIYNGFEINSHRAMIPSTINWNFSTNDLVLRSVYSLDSVIGVFKETFVYAEYNITVASFVSRVNRQIIVRNISLDSANTSTTVIINTFGTTFNQESPDFNFSIREYQNEFIIRGNTTIPENSHTNVLPIFIYMEKVPAQLILNNRQPWRAFITSLDGLEVNAFNAFKKATSTKLRLLEEHSHGWINTWDGGLIRVHSNSDLVTRSVHAAQYYILSSLPNKDWRNDDPSWLFYGLSPTGLAHGNTLNDYLGHVFWDMDTWMFPVILPFHNSLAAEMIKYRQIMLAAALDISRHSGYAGARYPWESARTGYETTYDPMVGKNEIHISSDISYAFQQFLWLHSKHQDSVYYDVGKDVISNIARFWQSRLAYNATLDRFEILNVMPPDEYVTGCNNSAYTNVAALKALEAPLLLAKRYHDNVTNEMLRWFEISKKIVYPYQEKLNLILEYDGYRIGSTVKQADVVLLQFPFQINVNENCILNNLNYYEKVTDMNGPAMTWAIFSINWFELQDSKKAEQYFLRNLDYIISPFYIWSEIINGKGARNFLTGMGGYLQNILYGYMGLRLRFLDDGQLIIDPTMTSIIPSISLHNITFQNSNLDIASTTTSLSVKLLNNYPISVFAATNNKTYLLTHADNQLIISNQRITITSSW